MCFGMLVDTTDSHLNQQKFLLVIREMTPFIRGELTSDSPEECQLLSNPRIWEYGVSFR